MRLVLLGLFALLVLAIPATARPAAPVAEAGGAATAAAAVRTYVLCKPRDSNERERRFRPRRCMTLAPGEPFAAASNLARLRWRGWGRRVATARGIEEGFRRDPLEIPVRVRAYARRPGCNGARVYTRLRIKSSDGTKHIRFHRRCAD